MKLSGDEDIQLFTYKQLHNIYDYVQEIIDSLPDKALEELTSGYGNDLNNLIDELTRQTHYVINHNSSKINSENLGYLSNLEAAFDNQLKKFSLNYFAATVPTNFESSWRTLEWGNMLQLYPWSGYLCQRGSGKCFAPDTEVVMNNGRLKKIKDIVVGDKLMGIDSTPRTVLSLHSGEDEMYEVQQANTEDYIVNSEHILHYKRGELTRELNKKNKVRYTLYDSKSHIEELPTKEFHKKTNYYKSHSFGYRVNGWELPEKKVKIEPYFLGLWLGDGTSVNSCVTNIDREVIDYIYEYSDRLGGLFEVSKRGITYRLKLKRRGRGILNPIIEWMKEYDILGNKNIPNDYLFNSRQQRLELLAGLIDSDGTTSSNKTSYSITQKDKNLLEQIQRLCWSLGFRANLKKRRKKLKYKNNEIYTSYDLHFSGDVWDIPCKINRKKIKRFDRVQDSQKSRLNTKKVGVGRYNGFECDGDHLFLLKDGTVVHNSYFFCYIVPLWRLYTYDPPHLMIGRETRDNRNRKETAIITNESRLGSLHIGKITEEIQVNDILKQKLNSSNKALGKEGIVTDTGSMLHLRSFGSQTRGLHIGMALIDDFLSRSALYSKEQRDKFHEVFYAEIMNIVEPEGHLIVSGCVSPTTIVLTNCGLRQIGDLCPENYRQEKKKIPFTKSIMGKDKLNSTSHYWCNGVSNNYKITTRFGYNLEGSDIHPILIMDEDGLMKWKKTPELKKEDYVCLRLNAGFGNSKGVKIENFKHNKRSRNKIKIDEYLNKDWCYFLGLWIADGSFDKSKSGFTITKQNNRIREFVLSGFNGTQFKVRKNDEIKMDFSSVELKTLFDIVGCDIKTAKYKTIPKKIFESNEIDIKYFLQGLFDGDGCFYVNKKGEPQINLSSISKDLISQVQVVLLHFGICSSVYNRGISISKKVIGKNDLYALNITGCDVKLFMDKIGFRFSNKEKNFKEVVEERSDYRKIPYQSTIFKKIRKEKKRVKRGELKGKLQSQAIYNKLSSKKVLKESLQFFIDNGASGEYTDIAKKNILNDYIFLPIRNIEKTKGYTVDFIIPEDHTFLSNGIVSHNTPFHSNDLYGDLKEDHRFKVFEYPGIFPDGKLLAPDRFTFQHLMDLKKSLGSIVFSREILVTPMSDGASIFPWEFLNKSFIGMENVRLVSNIQSFPIKLEKVVVGCDFAKSASVGADYTYYTVWGRDKNNTYYLLHIWRKKGASTNEQISKMVELDHAFRPNKIVCESNGFQSMIAEMARQRGLKNIEDFKTTAGNKKSEYEGLPSLSAFFERGEIKVPGHQEEYTKNAVMQLLGEFNSIGYDSDKGTLESIGEHDDGCMSSWIALYYLIENKVSGQIYYV